MHFSVALRHAPCPNSGHLFWYLVPSFLVDRSSSHAIRSNSSESRANSSEIRANFLVFHAIMFPRFLKIHIRLFLLYLKFVFSNQTNWCWGWILWHLRFLLCVLVCPSSFVIRVTSVKSWHNVKVIRYYN